jgi:hypothetical protein
MKIKCINNYCNIIKFIRNRSIQLQNFYKNFNIKIILTSRVIAQNSNLTWPYYNDENDN